MIEQYEDFVKYDLEKYYAIISKSYDLDPISDDLLKKANYYQGGLIGCVRAILEINGLPNFNAHLIALALAGVDYSDSNWKMRVPAAWTAALCTAEFVYCVRAVFTPSIETLFGVFIKISDSMAA